MNEYSDRIRQVATVFTPQDYTVTKSFLEANGILVLGTPHNFMLTSIRKDDVSGGVGILVPERQAQEAINLLIEIDKPEPQPVLKAAALKPVKDASTGWLSWLRAVFIYIFIDSGKRENKVSMKRIIHGEWKDLYSEDHPSDKSVSNT